MELFDPKEGKLYSARAIRALGRGSENLRELANRIREGKATALERKWIADLLIGAANAWDDGGDPDLRAHAVARALLLPAKIGGTQRKNHRDEEICKAIDQLLTRNERPLAAYSAVAKQQGMTIDAVRKVYKRKGQS